jgi:hypothetical protein
MLDCGVVRRGGVVLAFYRRPKAVPGRNISPATSTPAPAVVGRGGRRGQPGCGLDGTRRAGAAGRGSSSQRRGGRRRSRRRCWADATARRGRCSSGVARPAARGQVGVRNRRTGRRRAERGEGGRCGRHAGPESTAPGAGRGRARSWPREEGEGKEGERRKKGKKKRGKMRKGKRKRRKKRKKKEKKKLGKV